VNGGWQIRLPSTPTCPRKGLPRKDAKSNYFQIKTCSTLEQSSLLLFVFLPTVYPLEIMIFRPKISERRRFCADESARRVTIIATYESTAGLFKTVLALS
jgi:hypothetical protein